MLIIKGMDNQFIPFLYTFYPSILYVKILPAVNYKRSSVIGTIDTLIFCL